ncbi:MAG TPA: flagellar biosynthetic protein FliO [Sphingobium sp.]|uniref:flagellar biosynthetic protein FliO n=1 Tax=Sphingobium sp. TaxID=1912891 RepID=UPI002ED04409
MDLLSLLRMMGALLIVLGILAGGLWAVRRYDLRLPGALTAGLRSRGQPPRLALVERLSIDARRSVALIRRDDREHLLLIAPEGMLIVESGIFPITARTFQEEVEAHG